MKLTETNDKYVIEGVVECNDCKGTGLYVGMAERNGAAVVCIRCNGTGKVNVKETFNKFTERKTKKGVKRVYKTGAGYCIGAEDVTTEKGVTIRFSKGGVAYEDWKNGAKPKPIKDLHCPYMHTNQNLQCHDVNNLYKNRCKENLGWGNLSDCKCFKDKAKCWDIFEGSDL